MTTKLAFTVFAFVALPLLGSTASAQQRNQTIQLPAVNRFQIRNSVSVPDGGAIGLGGVSRNSAGTTARGLPGSIGRPFSNRAPGRQTSGSHASVRVWVLSKEEINKAILAGATLTKEPTVPYYKQAWNRQRQAPIQPKPTQRLEPTTVGQPTNPAGHPEGIFLGLP